MEVAVERIIRALQDGENILIYGDCDVDGVTSVSILCDGLFRLGGKVSFFIPNRFVEGYGVSEKGIQKARSREVSLIITVDCGITAIKEVEYARQYGIDVIICDHHEPAGERPNAVAILDPKVKGCSYPYKELAGCGVAFKLLQAITAKLGFSKDFALIDTGLSEQVNLVISRLDIATPNMKVRILNNSKQILQKTTKNNIKSKY
jgi:single-stranded-DNA-specific exonuclease